LRQMSRMQVGNGAETEAPSKITCGEKRGAHAAGSC
jgi:hypothetical protein